MVPSSCPFPWLSGTNSSSHFLPHCRRPSVLRSCCFVLLCFCPLVKLDFCQSLSPKTSGAQARLRSNCGIVNALFLGALCPSKSGLMNKHTVKHIHIVVRINTHVYHEIYRAPVQARTFQHKHGVKHEATYPYLSILTQFLSVPLRDLCFISESSVVPVPCYSSRLPVPLRTNARPPVKIITHLQKPRF